MMDAEENDNEELGAIPSDMFESAPSSVSALGGWATGAGSALFAVTKGVSSRVEGVSSRMSTRAKDMLSSRGDEGFDDEGRSPNGSPGGGTAGVNIKSVNKMNSNTASGILNGIGDDCAAPMIDEDEVRWLVSCLSAGTPLAEKMVAMNKLSSLLGQSSRMASKGALRSVALPLVAALCDAEHFEAFFANACIGCAQNILEFQGKAFATELVEAGAAQAVIPLLHPRFELMRIEGLAFLEALLSAEREGVCSGVVEFPTGMQALVDLLDDRWDEVRHQTVSLLAAFLSAGREAPAPVDLQNFVAFQDGFDKLFRVVGEASEDTTLRALAAIAGALTDNPLSQKLFVAGGNLSRLPALLAVLEARDQPDASPSELSKPAKSAAGRRRWGWGSNSNGGGGGGGGGGNDSRSSPMGSPRGSVDGGVGGRSSSRTGGGRRSLEPSPLSSPSALPSSSPRQAPPVRAGAGLGVGAGVGGGAGAGAVQAPVARIRAALSLLEALVGVGDEGGGALDDSRGSAAGVVGFGAGVGVGVGGVGVGVGVVGVGGGGGGSGDGQAATVAAAAAGDSVRGAVVREAGLLEAVCELALASPCAPAGGGPTWAEYGLPEDCHRSAVGVLSALIVGHPENQASLARCKIRGAPMSVTLHGQKKLVDPNPCNVMDTLVELWLAASLTAEREGAPSPGAGGGGAGRAEAAAEVSILDRLLDSFLLGNTPWCTSVLVGVASVHAATASVGDEGKKSPPRAPTPTPPASAGTTRPPRSGGSSGGGSGGSGGGVVVVDDDGYLAGGVIAMSDVIRRGLLGLAASGSNRGAASKADGRQRASSSLGGRSGGGGGSNDSTGGGGGGGGGSDVGDGGVSGDDDDPMAAALSLHLLRRMLQAGGADTRAVAASVGIPTEGARKRGEKKVRWQPPLQMGRKGDGRMALYGDDPENSTAEGGAWAEGDEEGEGGGVDQGGRVGDADGGVRLAPPLTPALEVAVRLLADGYNVAISLQTGALESGDGERPSPPSDLTRYLIALSEVLVVWLSCDGVGPALSRRLLASGSSWALLRTLGRALRPDSRRAQEGKMTTPTKQRGERRAAAMSEPSDDSSSAYLHALVTVVVGSFVCSAEGLTRGTLSAGIAKHVGLFEFCRALDAASDWVAFVQPPPTVQGSGRRRRGRGSSVPVFWALSGDPTFSSEMVGVVKAAQATIIRRIAGVDAETRPAGRKNIRGNFPDGHEKSNAFDGGRHDPAAGGRRALEGNSEDVASSEGNWAEDSDGLDGSGAWGRGACEELLLRQEARIEELERIVVSGGDEAIASPTLTI